MIDGIEIEDIIITGEKNNRRGVIAIIDGKEYILSGIDILQMCSLIQFNVAGRFGKEYLKADLVESVKQLKREGA